MTPAAPACPRRLRGPSPLQRICMVGFALDFAVMAGMTALPFFVFKQIGGGAAMSGAYGAAQGLAYTTLCLASAGIVQRLRNGLDLAAIGLAVFAVLTTMGAMFRGPVLCGALFALGIGSLALVWPALHSWVGTHPDPHRRARRMSWFNLSWSFGFAFSPLAAGPLYDLDYRLPFALLFALTLVCIALVRSLPNERQMPGSSGEGEAGDRVSIRRSEMHLAPAMTALVVANALAGVTRTVFPKRIDELVSSGALRWLWEASPSPLLMSAPATKYSWLACALSIASAVMFIVLGRTRRWQHHFGIPVGLQVLAAGAFWVLGSTRSLVAMVMCFAIIGATIGLAFFASIFYCVANPARRHARAAMNEAAVGAGGLAGNLLFGAFVERCGHATTYHWTPLVVAAAIVVQVMLLARNQRLHRQTPA